MGKQNLIDRRIALLATDGHEQLELQRPYLALKAAGAQVDIISLRRGSIKGMDFCRISGKTKVDLSLSRAQAAEYDGLFIPGGFISPDLLRQSLLAREFVAAFDWQNKPIASLGHAPWLLVSAGLVAGRTLTSWPGIRDDLVNAGACWLNQPVVRDGNLLTARDSQDLPAFIQEMLNLFTENFVFDQGFINNEESSEAVTDPALDGSGIRGSRTGKFLTTLIGTIALSACYKMFKKIHHKTEHPTSHILLH